MSLLQGNWKNHYNIFKIGSQNTDDTLNGFSKLDQNIIISIDIFWLLINLFFIFQVKRKDAILTKCFHVFCFDCLRTR